MTILSSNNDTQYSPIRFLHCLNLIVPLLVFLNKFKSTKKTFSFLKQLAHVFIFVIYFITKRDNLSE